MQKIFFIYANGFLILHANDILNINYTLKDFMF